VAAEGVAEGAAEGAAGAAAGGAAGAVDEVAAGGAAGAAAGAARQRAARKAERRPIGTARRAAQSYLGASQSALNVGRKRAGVNAATMAAAGEGARRSPSSPPPLSPRATVRSSAI
jgi:hypothetical protein